MVRSPWRWPSTLVGKGSGWPALGAIIRNGWSQVMSTTRKGKPVYINPLKLNGKLYCDEPSTLARVRTIFPLLAPEHSNKAAT
jgi:hypothetical protein